jgi:hypothetical protein
MAGRSVYSLWLEKYGKEEADRRMGELKQKHSKNNSGKGNPMFGKPSPKGTGQGWKGWYKSYYFRSLRELNYMIDLEDSGVKWESGEQKILTIPYQDYNGIDRTYRADFFVEGKNLVEIKPIRLQSSPLITLKNQAAEQFCKEKGFTFEIVDVQIDSIKIKQELDAGNVKFDRDYEKRFLKYCNI